VQHARARPRTACADCGSSGWPTCVNLSVQVVRLCALLYFQLDMTRMSD
jgi:hypothetical protein